MSEETNRELKKCGHICTQGRYAYCFTCRMKALNDGEDPWNNPEWEIKPLEDLDG